MASFQGSEEEGTLLLLGLGLCIFYSGLGEKVMKQTLNQIG